MTGIRTFWMTPTDRACVFLRRYTYTELPEGAPPVCPGSRWGHQAPRTVALDDAPLDSWLRVVVDETTGRWHYDDAGARVESDDPRWPKTCAACEYEFQPNDPRSTSAERLYDGAPDGIRRPIRDFPVGALYDCEWLNDYPDYTGPDGIALCCITPGGHWMVDSQASNCTRDQYERFTDESGREARRFTRTHYCWVRHGDPRTEPVTVDKNGETCSAGAGSILAGNWHGFLRNGFLVT